jgi:hypothetical protein
MPRSYYGSPLTSNTSWIWQYGAKVSLHSLAFDLQNMANYFNALQFGRDR